MKLPPLRVQQVTRPMAHLIAAREFIVGIEAISVSGRTADRALALLAGQAVESLLEGYILSALTTGESPRDFGHDLEKLWHAARLRGLGLAKEPPIWCELLARGHRSPFAVRYQAARDGSVKAYVHGSSYAPMHLLVTEIPKLELLVAPSIEKHQREHG